MVMSSDSHGNDGETRDRRLIREAKEECFHARRKLRREQPDPSEQTRQLLCAALGDYRDVLWDYHDERALETPWDERAVDVDVVEQWLSQTVKSNDDLPRRGDAQTAVTVPMSRHVPATQLLHVAKELDAIAKELGFAAPAKDPTPNEEAELSDLRGLLKSRGQTEAMDNLPGDGDE